ncbi:uncharacterized protein LOC110188619 [Drosophila serrata]|uniref:uncharacterized protein LOC110188619 n=1 Tax=Drosophila serrata TaxID=7274 RepID=UPI000A1CF3C7|nr:uncharacterized protein LOC110188619 [Drosophila serrata]
MSIVAEETKESIIAFDSSFQPTWLEWVERNAKPIKRRINREPRIVTRWKKQGPMKNSDWRRFYVWAATKSLPKELPEVEVEPIPCPEKYLPCAKPPRQIDPEDLEERIAELATPLERKMTPKHEYDYPVNAYSPVIVWGQPAHHDKGRPFEPPKVPCCFANSDVEGEFWANLRFPIRPAALKAKISPRILSLSKPKVTPQFPPHCYHPEHVYDILDVKPPMKRKKFTPQGWRLHQIRLLYLSQPVTRREYEYFYM